MEIEPDKLREMVREAYLEGCKLASGYRWTKDRASFAWRTSAVREDLEKVLRSSSQPEASP